MKRIIILLVILVLSLMGVTSADPTMSVSQQPSGIGINDTFIAEVTVDPVDGEIYAAQYDLYFNSTILQATKPIPGDFLSQGGVETYVIDDINNTIGKIEYAETRLGDPEDVGGVTEPGILASINFTVIGEGVSDLTLVNVKFSDLKQFLINGHICCCDGSSCNNPAVSITNLNTSEEWEANITADGNYYQIILRSGTDLNASEILRFNATDGTKSNVTDYTITADDVTNCGLINFDLIVPCRRGDVDNNEIINIMDVRLLTNHVSDPEEYPIGNGCEWAGDIDDSGGINMTDVQLLLDRVFKI